MSEYEGNQTDDGSDKPLGYTTPDGELTVVITNGERHYRETDFGQTRRWMRQAPDLYEMYLKAVEGRTQVLAHMTRMAAEHAGREKAWSHDRQQMENDAAAVRADERAKTLDAVEQALRSKLTPQSAYEAASLVLRELRGEVPHE